MSARKEKQKQLKQPQQTSGSRFGVYLEHSSAKDKLIISQKSMIEVGKNHLYPGKVEGRRRKSSSLRWKHSRRASFKGCSNI